MICHRTNGTFSEGARTASRIENDKSMKLLGLRLLWMTLFATLATWAQSTMISSIRIYTTPDGARFYVDGQVYFASQTFLWPAGSRHVVQFPLEVVDGVTTNYQNSQDGTIRYTFGGWVDSGGNLIPGADSTQVITATPALTSMSAALSLQYKVLLRFSSSPTAPPGCGGAPGNPPQDANRSGLVYIDTTCFGSNTDLLSTAGAHTLNAFPYPGWVFTGWNINGATYPSYLTKFTLIGATTIYPIFQQGHRVQFVTEPVGLQLLVDRTPTPTSTYGILDTSIVGNTPCTTGASLLPGAPAGFTPLCLGEFDFLPGSQHVFAAVTPQYDRTSTLWVFDSFSNSMAQNAVYTTPTNTSVRENITAKFVRGVQVAFLTSPNGLKVQVDGTDKWQTYNFAWAAGSTHTVTAAPSQVDSAGRKWTFQGWSNGGAATQTITADLASPDSRYTATYTALGQVKVTTIPSGIKLQLDGADCTTPCSVDRNSGTSVKIVAPASIPQDASSRLDFQGWNDGAGTAARTFTFDGGVRTITGSYSPSYRLALSSDPADGVDLNVDPPSSDLYYSSDTPVTISAKARAGFKFRRWSGDAAGVYPSVQVRLSGPQAVVAMLDRVPYIAPAGIRNAAGNTVDGAVAPGSIIAIFGQSLAPRTEVGPTNPLAQAIADTIVTVNDRILPLLFVSPTQINAQVLSDLPDGIYTLKVQSTGLATVTGTFTISRDAPGLFTRATDTATISLASHEDGTAITPDSPARRGETISIYGTGFGPYDQKVIDGFIIPDPSNYKVLDPVEVAAGDQTIQPVWAGAAPGYVGTTLTKIKVDDSLPAATNVEIIVKVNGKPSNKVLLPVE